MPSPRIIVCYTKCWACNFDQHDSKWHPWADFEDVEHAANTGQPDPSDQKCGCYCCADAKPTTNPTHQPAAQTETRGDV